MKPNEKIAKIICDIEERVKDLEVKVNIIAVQVGLINYCECFPEPKHKIDLQGMPCCPRCEKIIRSMIEPIN